MHGQQNIKFNKVVLYMNISAPPHIHYTAAR